LPQTFLFDQAIMGVRNYSAHPCTNVCQTVSILSAPTYRFAACSRFKQQVTNQRNFVIDSVTVTRERSVMWKTILAKSIIYRGCHDNALRKKAILFVSRPYVSFADEQKSLIVYAVYLHISLFTCQERKKGCSNLFSMLQTKNIRYSCPDYHQIELQ